MRGTVLLFANYYATVSILRAVTPAFGRLAAVEARLEGEYRAGMGRVGREAEEVAYAAFPLILFWGLTFSDHRFYDGGARERDILTRAYMRLIKHVNSIYKVCNPLFPMVLIDVKSIVCRSVSRMSGQRTMSSSICGPRLDMA